MIKLKDVIHLYIGCSVQFNEPDDTENELIGVVIHECHLHNKTHNMYGSCDISKLKPVLRPLSDMNDTECDEVGCDIQDGEYDKGTITSDCIIAGTYHVKSIRGSAEAIMWLLRNHFDIFGLIESGQAIDATKI